MKRAILVACAVALLVTVPRPVSAWGAVAHQLITRRAIDLLPPAMKPFYEHVREELVLRSNDPDLWRNVPWDDDANHFLDFGIPEFGPPPFVELPRERGAATAKFGAANLKRWGTLPWRVEEMAGSLRRAFEGMSRQSPYAISEVTLFSAVIAHYVQDATQPLHASDNYDGQLTGNHGVHARFERDLIEQYASRLQLQPQAPATVGTVRDFAFDTLVHSHGLVGAVLAADKAAIGAKDTYDAGYYDAFFASMKPLVEQQLSAAISATAGVLVSAWEQAGRPTLYTVPPRPPQRVRR
jgi:hypothetical protein